MLNSKLAASMIVAIIVVIIVGIMISTRTSTQLSEEGLGVVETPVETITVGEIADQAKAPVVIAEEGTKPGQQLPNFKLRDQDGNEVELAALRGQPVIVDFWAEWCPFCTGEMPDLQDAFEKHSDSGLVILGVHRENNIESFEDGLRFAERIGITYPLLDDILGDRVYANLLKGQNFMPVAFFLDRDGIIVSRDFGPKSSEKIEAGVQKIL